MNQVEPVAVVTPPVLKRRSGRKKATRPVSVAVTTAKRKRKVKATTTLKFVTSKDDEFNLVTLLENVKIGTFTNEEAAAMDNSYMTTDQHRKKCDRHEADVSMSWNMIPT